MAYSLPPTPSIVTTRPVSVNPKDIATSMSKIDTCEPVSTNISPLAVRPLCVEREFPSLSALASYCPMTQLTKGLLSRKPDGYMIQLCAVSLQAENVSDVPNEATCFPRRGLAAFAA